MKELVYLSEGKTDRSDAWIPDMLERARTFNKQNEITGVLICDNKKRFIQVIEGDDTIIDELYSRIQKDERHSAVLLIHETTITSRNFHEWSMAFKETTSDFATLGFYRFLEPSKKNSETVQLIKQFYLSGT
jgi:hypothetical protein